MANFHFYFVSCALLLALSWRTAAGLPVPTQGAERCPLLFRKLLLSITDLLNDPNLCYGITSDKVVVRSQAETLLACAPTLTPSSSCMIQRNSSFSESECLRNIMKDLVYYEAIINSYMVSPRRSPEEEDKRLNPTLDTIKHLKNCSLMPNEDNDSTEKVAAKTWEKDTFSNRQEMCKMMRGFHVRTITINRAMGYISSGDHKK